MLPTPQVININFYRWCMKVAYNKCYGGFGLSAAALTEFAKRKGFVLTWYKQVGYRHDGDERYERVAGCPVSSGFGVYSLTEDLGPELTTLPNKGFYHPGFDNRTDSDLIEVIEQLGRGADGFCADLAIAEIPDGREFEIEEYDGFESVVPPREAW